MPMFSIGRQRSQNTLCRLTRYSKIIHRNLSLKYGNMSNQQVRIIVVVKNMLLSGITRVQFEIKCKSYLAIQLSFPEDDKENLSIAGSKSKF